MRKRFGKLGAALSVGGMLAGNVDAKQIEPPIPLKPAVSKKFDSFRKQRLPLTESQITERWAVESEAKHIVETYRANLSRHREMLSKYSDALQNPIATNLESRLSPAKSEASELLLLILRDISEIGKLQSHDSQLQYSAQYTVDRRMEMLLTNGLFETFWKLPESDQLNAYRQLLKP